MIFCHSVFSHHLKDDHLFRVNDAIILWGMMTREAVKCEVVAVYLVDKINRLDEKFCYPCLVA